MFNSKEDRKGVRLNSKFEKLKQTQTSNSGICLLRLCFFNDS